MSIREVTIDQYRIALGQPRTCIGEARGIGYKYELYAGDAKTTGYVGVALIADGPTGIPVKLFLFDDGDYIASHREAWDFVLDQVEADLATEMAGG